MKDKVLLEAVSENISLSIIDNYIIAWQEITKVFGYPDTNQLFGIKGFLTGIPYMMMNSLFDGPESITNESISNVIQYFKNKNLPMMWFISQIGIERGIDKILDDLGIEQAKMQVPGMAVDLLKIDPNMLKKKKSKHDITHIKEEMDTETYTRIFMESFEVDLNIRGSMESFTAEFTKFPNACHFLAKIDSKIVACASVIYTAGVAGIYHVATLPNYRGRGLAESLTSACMLDALNGGYQYSILHSSSKGHSVYEKLGYTDYFIFKRYLLRPEDVGL